MNHTVGAVYDISLVSSQHNYKSYCTINPLRDHLILKIVGTEMLPAV